MTRFAKLLMVCGLPLLVAACGGSDPAPEQARKESNSPSPEAMARQATAAEEAMAAAAAETAATAALIESALLTSYRSPGNAARNGYRHPVETLTFFGMTPDATVVEVWPGGGSAWYTEILAPVLRADGKLVAAGWSLERGQDWQVRAQTAFNEKMTAHPEVYDAVEVIGFQGDGDVLGAAGSADLVLLSRHFHNFIAQDITSAVLEASFDVLKPGGVLGVIQHRADEDSTLESEERDGYVKESTVIAAAEAAGFVLEGRSEANANPADTKDHVEGVWTLPPSLAACEELTGAEKFECVARYRAIGESDRMTLKFIKPAA